MYAILRFAKYKGPEIGRTEAHNERAKERYASNPDVDTSRSHLNVHLVEPRGHYRAEAERQIAQAGCRSRSDSVRLVEPLMTGSPELFRGKNPQEICAYFRHALDFLTQRQRPETILSAVIHLDKKTPAHARNLRAPHGGQPTVRQGDHRQPQAVDPVARRFLPAHEPGNIPSWSGARAPPKQAGITSRPGCSSKWPGSTSKRNAWKPCWMG